MKLITKTKNLQLTPDLSSYVEEKIGSVKKFINILKKDESEGLKTLAEVFVELEKETNHHKNGDIFWARAQVNLPGKSLEAKANSDDLLKAIVALKDQLQVEIEKYKFKNVDKRRREQRKSKREITK